MKISDLPRGLRELAERRRQECGRIQYEWLMTAFNSSSTPEGFDFWLEIYKGNFTPYYNCRVVNLKPKP